MARHKEELVAMKSEMNELLGKMSTILDHIDKPNYHSCVCQTTQNGSQNIKFDESKNWREENAELRAQLEDMKYELTKKEKLKEEIARLSRDLEDNSNKELTAHEMERLLRGKLVATEVELEKAEKLVAQLRSDNSQLKEDLDDMMSKLDDIQDERNKQDVELSELRDKVNNQGAENHKESGLLNDKEEAGLLKVKIAQLEEANQELENRLASENDENGHLLKDRIEHLEKELEAKSKQVEENGEQFAEQRMVINGQEQDILRLESENVQKDSLIEQLQKEKQVLEEDKEKIVLRSKEWAAKFQEEIERLKNEKKDSKEYDTKSCDNNEAAAETFTRKPHNDDKKSNTEENKFEKQSNGVQREYSRRPSQNSSSHAESVPIRVTDDYEVLEFSRKLVGCELEYKRNTKQKFQPLCSLSKSNTYSGNLPSTLLCRCPKCRSHNEVMRKNNYHF